MKNPWEEISLADYENHMKLDSVMQLQAMNEMMKGQLSDYAISSVMILGVAGGNGLEHISKVKFAKVYGVDVNSDYLKEVVHRYPDLDGLFECFQKTIQQVNPKYVSCIIQINIEDNWVSDSPYLHVFDGLEQIHCQMEEHALEKAMLKIIIMWLRLWSICCLMEKN